MLFWKILTSKLGSFAQTRIKQFPHFHSLSTQCQILKKQKFHILNNLCRLYLLNIVQIGIQPGPLLRLPFHPRHKYLSVFTVWMFQISVFLRFHSYLEISSLVHILNLMFLIVILEISTDTAQNKINRGSLSVPSMQ